MIEAREKNDVAPVCPHCAEPVGEVWYQAVSGVFGKRYVYFCSRCLKVLGLSHRKGFWMG